MGYAFVNFITVQDLLLFAKTQIGVKWCVALLVEFLARPERVAGTCTRARRPSRCVMPRTSESSATRRISPARSHLRRLRGKESLVEKFKNSCIMDEKEAWRPMTKITHLAQLSMTYRYSFVLPCTIIFVSTSQHTSVA